MSLYSRRPENAPISSEALAYKLAALRNYENEEVLAQIEAQPRFVEVLWFLQFMSNPRTNAGGLRRFVGDFVGDSLDLIGPSLMSEAPRGQKFTLANACALLGQIPDSDRVELRSLILGEGKAKLPGVQCREEDCELRLALELCSRSSDSSKYVGAAERELTHFTREALEAFCSKIARDSLPTFLRRLCEETAVGFLPLPESNEHLWRTSEAVPWFFPRLGEALLRFIDRRGATILARIGETGVTRAVFRWLEKSRRCGRAVAIRGNSRFGKTEAASAWCDAHAGRARLIKTPDGNSKSELLRAVGEAVGISIEGPLTATDCELITYVINEARLSLIFDESQFLYPSKFTKNTAPARLDWLRRAVIDNGVPVALIATPQGYDGARKRYQKATNYALEQFEERILKTVQLPSELPKEELLAVAKIHFPDLGADYLEYVVACAAATERNYVSDIEKVAALSYDAAREAGRAKPSLKDIEEAIADVLPAVAKGDSESAPAAVARPEVPRKSKPARVARQLEGKQLHNPERGTRPVVVPMPLQPSLVAAG